MAFQKVKYPTKIGFYCFITPSVYGGGFGSWYKWIYLSIDDYLDFFDLDFSESWSYCILMVEPVYFGTSLEDIQKTLDNFNDIDIIPIEAEPQKEEKCDESTI